VIRAIFPESFPVFVLMTFSFRYYIFRLAIMYRSVHN
jgi:hypothetical protein